MGAGSPIAAGLDPPDEQGPGPPHGGRGVLRRRTTRSVVNSCTLALGRATAGADIG